MQAAKELLALYSAIAIVPLTPVLALTFAQAPWQGVMLAAAWAACWYLWIWGRVWR